MNIYSVPATDFANRESYSQSSGVVIDVTPPSVTDKPITIAERHITSTSEVEAWSVNIRSLHFSYIFP
jgi:hypothetical protein